MAIAYNTSVVRNGLVLHLDAANRKSYPGTGTAWSDLSGNGNNGTLVNGVTYNSANNGSITFDGVNDYISIAQNSSYRFSNTQAFSISAWIRCTATSGFSTILSYALPTGRGYYFSIDVNSLRTNSFVFDYFDGTSSSFRGIQGNINSITMNSWINLVATSATNSVNDMKVYQKHASFFKQVYINVSKRKSENRKKTIYLSRRNFKSKSRNINYDTLSLRIGSRGDSGYFTGNMSQISVYNSSITALEVKQNFEALRGRYGI